MSVVELVAAVAILSVSICMLIGCFYGASALNARARDSLHAQMVGRTLFEEMRADGFAQFLSENDLPPDSMSVLWERDGCTAEITAENRGDGTEKCTVDVYRTGQTDGKPICTLQFCCVE